MTKLKSILPAVILAVTTVLGPATALAQPAGPEDSNCLYPSPTDRFGVTVFHDQSIDWYDVRPLSAGKYLDWQARLSPSQPSGMRYYHMIHVSESAFYPSDDTLRQIVRANIGSTWMIGNEADVFWQDNVTPEAYARHFHDAYVTIREIDPTAKFASNGVGQVSRLRLAWLDRVLSAYRTLYGTEIPVDIWNIHTYIANEMHLQWGSEIPPGIPNAVGYTVNYGTQWSMATDTGASGGTVHESRTTGADAWFAFHGNEVTIFLRSGPDAGIAAIYLDQSATPVAEVDLYAASRGTVSRRYTNLAPVTGYEDRHAIRVEVTGRKNAASSNTWVRVDAIRAPSTYTLPGGRFEDNDPLRARIITNIDDHANVDKIVEQIRDFRQWMLNKGLRNKPLIDTEHGILGTADLGFDYLRVRTFMLDSFNRFLNNLVDANLGYPEDGNRMLQEWFWFALAVDQFEGRVSNSGLYSVQTRQIKPLGQDFAAYVTTLKQNYRDLEAYALTLTPTWALFSGDRSLIKIQGVVRNVGNSAAGPFQVVSRLGNGTQIAAWNVTGLAQRFEPGHTQELTYDWQEVISSNRTIKLIADEADQIVEPCGSTNNTKQVQLVAPALTDLAVSNLTTVPALVPPIESGTTTTVSLKVNLDNLGSIGTSLPQLSVKFWDGDPAAGGTLIGSQAFNRGGVTLPATATVNWPNVPPGNHTVFATVDAAPEETNLQNNRQTISFFVPVGVAYFPLIRDRGRVTEDEVPGTMTSPKAGSTLWWLP